MSDIGAAALFTGIVLLCVPIGVFLVVVASNEIRYRFGNH